MSENRFRKDLSKTGLLKICRNVFDGIPNTKKRRSISLSESLISALALFGLKIPSLLQFDNGRNDTTIKNNLQTLYSIMKAPCDTYALMMLTRNILKYYSKN